MCRNIISVSCLDNDGFYFIIKNNNCSIFHKDMFYAKAYLQDGLYVMNLQKSNNSYVYNITTKKFKSNDLNSTYLLHCRLGHINEKCISKLHQVGLLNSFDFKSYDTCESCLLGKMKKDPFTRPSARANELLDLIHTDVCGPLSSDARGGYKYFITFTDDFSRYGYVYLMRHKSESFEMFKSFQNEVQNKLGKTIKALQSDRGGEYLSQEFDDHLRTCGIISQLTPPGTPQWNGVSDRRNRTLLDMVRYMMSPIDLPFTFWGYALETAAFTLNRVPSKAVEKTPYEMWTGKRPSLSFLKIWGCECSDPRARPDSMASPNQNPGDARLILFIFRIIKFSFQKCRDPNPRLHPNDGSEPEPGLLRRFHLSYQNILLIYLVVEAVSVLGKPIIIYHSNHFGRPININKIYLQRKAFYALFKMIHKNQVSRFNPFVYKIPLVQKRLYANDGVYTYTPYSLYDSALHDLVSLPV